MVASQRDKVAAIREFTDWLAKEGLEIVTYPWDDVISSEDPEQLLTRFTDEVLTECDTAIAHGPGHQSISPCIVTGPHVEHYSDRGHDWSDSKVTDQTKTENRRIRGHKVSQTYRLAFEPYMGW